MTFESRWGHAQALPPGSELTLNLAAEEIYEEMIDGEVIFALAYRNLDTGALRPILHMSEFDRVTLTLENRTSRTVGFLISGVPAASIPVLAPGAAGSVSFTAPEGGSYIYHDPVNAPVQRVLGLHGAMVSRPADGLSPLGTALPYSAASQSLNSQRLFEALGGTGPRFPGNPWDPDDVKRQRVWVFNTIDSRFNRRLERGREIDPVEFVQIARPEYFTLNGLSGYDAAHDEDTVPKGCVGQPCLIRSMNVGLATHAPHIHGNHVFLLSDRGTDDAVVVNQNIVELDTWMMRPMDRKDVLLPFEVPPDIPPAAWPPREEPFPFKYPMHCHMEMSQTAGGGSYPQGLVTDWELLGPEIPAEA